MERRHIKSREEMFTRMKREIGDRLRCVCQDMTEEEFDELVARAAKVQMKYLMRRTPRTTLE